MPRYFIDVHLREGIVADEIGEVLPSLSDAKQIAIQTLAEIAAFSFLETEMLKVQLRDEAGQTMWSAVLKGEPLANPQGHINPEPAS